MDTLIDRPIDPSRRRFYMVEMDFMRPIHDIEVLNEDEFIRNGWQGRHEFRKYAGKDIEGDDQYYGGFYGLPILAARPKIKVGSQSKLTDAYKFSGAYYFSTRAKNLLESIDADAFEFTECDTITRGDERIESYWMTEVKRVVTEYDEERSIISERGGRDPHPVPVDIAVGIRTVWDLFMLPDFPQEWHAFYLVKYRTHFLFDEAIVDEWRKHQFNSLLFSPLQPPLMREIKHIRRYHNAEYFFEEGRQYWEHLT